MLPQLSHSRLFRRYLKSAAGYWKGKTGLLPWSLSIFLIILILLQLYVQYRINFWNRDFFDALNHRDVSQIHYEAWLFLPLAIASVVIAVLMVWAKMAAQRNWRKWLSNHLLSYWIKDDHYVKLPEMKNHPRNAEFRIAEDIRVATDLPFELMLGLLSSLLTAITFIGILWQVGGSLPVSVLGVSFYIPGYLVLAALLYSAILTASTLTIANYLTGAVEEKNSSEAEYRSTASRLRSHGEESVEQVKVDEKGAVKKALNNVIDSWRKLSYQLMKTTSISTGNAVLAPVIGLLFCTPKFLYSGMSIGEVVQAAAAFVTVQNSFNWLLNNYPSIADYVSSSNRVALLLYGLDELEGIKEEDEPH